MRIVIERLEDFVLDLASNLIKFRSYEWKIPEMEITETRRAANQLTVLHYESETVRLSVRPSDSFMASLRYPTVLEIASLNHSRVPRVPVFCNRTIGFYSIDE